MAKIGKLFLDFEAGTAKFNEPVKRASRNLRNFGKDAKKTQTALGRFGDSLKKTLTSFKGLAVVAATVATFRAATGAFKQLAQELDDLAKTSRKLGVLPRDLQVLQVAGELTGVSISKMNMALQRMTRRVAEAAQGTGEAVKALKELGIDAKVLNELPLQEKFIALGEAFRQIENPADRVRLAMKLFDSEGVDLVNTLDLLPSQIRGTGKSLDEMRHNLTGPQLNAIETMNDAFLGLNRAIGANFRQALATLAPMLTAFANVMAEVVVVLGQMVGGFGQLANLVGRDVVGFAFFAFHNILVRIMGLFNNLHGVAMVVIGKISQGLAAMVDVFQNAVQGIFDLGNFAIKHINKIPKVNIGFELPKAGEFSAAFKELADELVEEGFGKMNLGLDQMLSPEAIKGTEVLIELMTTAKSLAIDSNATPLLNITDEGVGGLVDKLGEGVNKAEQFGENLSEALGKGLVGGEKLSGILARIAEQLAGDALTNIFRNLLGVQSSAGQSSGGFLSKLGGFIFGGARAEGGPVSMGKSYLVGESGPELFTPRASGTITPGGAVGMTVNNYFDIRGSDDQIQRQIAASVDMAVSMSVGKMQDLRNRGSIR